MSDPDWPDVPPHVLAFISRNFKHVRHLDAAFDTLEDCEGLITSGFPEMVGEEARDIAMALLLWKENNKRGLKRSRTALVDHCFSELGRIQHCSSNIQDEYKTILGSSALCLLESHAKRKQQKYKEEPADARSRRFESERRKFALLLSEMIREACLPVADTINKLDDPKEGWLRLFSTRRANTLKNRYKAWKPFRDWLEIHRSRVFPLSLKDAVDYMQFRMGESCGKSVPGSFSTALHLMELVGRVPDADKISKDPLWDGFVRSWTAELNVAAPPATPAPMFSVAMCISLECRVLDEQAPLFSRALSWVVLLMVWSSFRCDDVQAIIPHRTLISQIGLRLTLGRSKTTGPDKHQKEVKAFVFRQASFTGHDWLGAGYSIWDSDLFRYKRDYLVMEPSKDWTSVKRKFLPPNGLSSAIISLLSTLGTPRRANFTWSTVDTTLLLPDGLEQFFTGHSPRNFMTSVAAVLGFSRDQRAYLGRWTMGMVASEEYVRTSRQVVTLIQKTVNEAIVSGHPGVYREDEVIEALCAEASAGGANPLRIRKRHAVMNDVTGKHCLGGFYPTLDVSEVGDVEVVDDTPDFDELDVLVERHPPLSEQKAAKFFITISRRTAFRRLHMAGCFIKPSHCMEVRYLDEVLVEEFDSICRACKKRMFQESGKEAGELSSSTASSSSTEDAPEAGQSD